MYKDDAVEEISEKERKRAIYNLEVALCKMTS